MSSAEVIQVIRTSLTLRGDGKTDPMRRIEQYWSLDGQLLAEVDPLSGSTASMEASSGPAEPPHI